ncbi:MAG: response regulator, partial [Pyrinomonadaceae bacterium]|nr:response regulator [Pyrinomonadaceae bacterium]
MQRQILIIDDHDDLATALEEVFVHNGHRVRIVKDRDEALAIGKFDPFDLVITDLDLMPGDPACVSDASGFCLASPDRVGEHIKAFKVGAGNFRRDHLDEEELQAMV